ncbi:DNA endonuclease SmrA [Oceanimonas sp. CHS3-5]|uniref:DNA endonuclease SmrA n=1 Tax=Oceanimonas sp. CHS3-5 TaxID=3068186 RepID=UPI00273DC8FE|nr:DNA endonuclease SmrA [Oceanimonas sp. CHS3-5]MDP5292307.1 DNA endonuclease SmrA [Oceanimonas sp. CHS3-5]
MSHSDWSSFLGELDGLTPIKQDTLPTGHRDERDAAVLAERRRAAETEADAAEPGLSLDNVVLLRPDDMVSYKKPGVQDGVFKKLRLGKYPCEARLDLHHHSVERARDALLNFIRACLRQDLRSVVIVHGKGERCQPPALLKSYVSGWLPQLPEVLACHSALRQHGGSGCLYVLLRKSEQAKQHTRERLQSRQG